MLSQQDVLPGLREIVAEIAGVSGELIEPGMSFTEDLAVDSLSMVEIVTSAETRFSVSIPDEDLPSLETVGDAVVYISRASVTA